MPLLHPQPEDAPCPGDRDPLITASSGTFITKLSKYLVKMAPDDVSNKPKHVAN